jgi:hypothetical protein
VLFALESGSEIHSFSFHACKPWLKKKPIYRIYAFKEKIWALDLSGIEVSNVIHLYFFHDPMRHSRSKRPTIWSNIEMYNLFSKTSMRFPFVPI